MKIHEYNEMMAYLTRPAPKKVAGLMEEYYGSDQLKYQEAVKNGFQGTFEEYLQWMRQNAAQGGVIGQGGMFQGEDMGYRTGFAGPKPGYKAKETKDLLGRNKVLRIFKDAQGIDKPVWSVAEPTGDFKKWYDENYTQKWDDLSQKRNVMLRYLKELKEVPEGYILARKYNELYNFPVTEPKWRKAKGAKTETYIQQLLSNPEVAQTGKFSRKKGDINITRKFIAEKLKAKKIGGRWYVKDLGQTQADEIFNFLKKETLENKTVNVINKLLDNNKIKNLFNAGNYKGVKEALKKIENITSAEKGNAVIRIAQLMSGTNFRNKTPDVKLNKSSAKEIFNGLDGEKWGDPFNDSFKYFKKNTIRNALGDSYFTKSYDGFISDARDAIAKTLNMSRKDLSKLKLDINELTGLTNAYRNQTFSSSQFINLMDNEFNTNQHANLMAQYGKSEAKLQKALSGKKPNLKEVSNIIKEWRQWKDDWFHGRKQFVGLDEKYKTKEVKSILPDFELGANASKKVFTAKRLEEFRKMNFPIAEEIKKRGYAKTFGTKEVMSKAPVLREIATGSKKAIFQSLKNLLITANPATKIKIGKALNCPTAQSLNSGGRVGFAVGTGLDNCIMSKLQADPEGTLNKTGRVVPETRTPIMNALKKFGGGTLKWGGRAFVGLAPVFGVMTVQDIAKGMEEGLPAGEVAAQAIGEWTLPGMGEWYKDIQRNKMMKDIATPDELASLEKSKKYDEGKALLEGSQQAGIRHGSAESQIEYAKELMEKNQPTDEDSKNIFKLIQKQETTYDLQKEERKGMRKERQEEFFGDLEEKAESYGYNQGGRVGFAKGPKSPGRRAFIKGVTALAALPLVGKYFKLGKVLERASTYTGPAIQKIKGMPEWFPSLVKRLWNEGEDVTKQVAYGERQVVKRGTLEGGDDVDLIYEMDTGNVSIDVTPKKGTYETGSGAYNKEYSLDYKKGEEIATRKGSVKTPDEFDVREIEGAMDPHAMDVNWEGKITDVDDAMSDLTELEAFAKKQSTKKIHKKKGTTKKDVFPDYDPGDYDID